MIKSCAMVIATGNTQWIIGAKKYAWPIIKKYFNDNGHEAFLIESTPFEKDNIDHPSWLCLKCHDILPDYDYILTWDLDLVPIKMEDDIFKTLNMDLIGACIDISHKQYAQFPHFKYNCGLVGIPQKEYNFFTEVYNNYKTNPKNWGSYEQFYVNMELGEQKKEVQEIDSKYNCFFGQPNPSCLHYTYAINKEQAIKLIKVQYDKIFT